MLAESNDLGRVGLREREEKKKYDGYAGTQEKKKVICTAQEERRKSKRG